MRSAQTVHLADGLRLKKKLIMRSPRLELMGFADTSLAHFKAQGLIAEIIDWRTRLFVPLSDDGPAILARLLAAHPIMSAPAA